MVEADGDQDRRNLQRFVDATRPAGHRNALHVEHQRQPLALDEFGADVQVGGDAARAGFGSVEFHVRNRVPYPFPKPLLQTGCVRTPSRQFAGCNFRSDARANDGRNIFRTGSQPALLYAAMEEALQTRAPVPVENPHAFGPIKTMRRQRKQSDTHGLNVDR